MRKMFLLITGSFFMFSCGLSPAEITATANSALQQTQTAAPTNTSTPTLTPTSTLTPTATPTPLGGGGIIAFTSTNGSNDKIIFYNIDIGITYPINIQFTEDIEEASKTFGTSSVVVSPDSTKLAFSQVICQSGKNLQRATNCRRDIFTSNIDGSNVIRLTDTKELDEDDFAWSPDGEKIAYINDYILNDLCVIHSDGSGRKCIDTAGRNVFRPTWSPDGTKIAFSSQRNGPFQIYVINADGGNLIQLTQIMGAMSNSPSWSPDGLRIVFRVRYTNHENSNGDIYIMNSDGSNPTNLTNGKYDEVGAPIWSPNGDLILFNCNANVCTMFPDGTEVVDLKNFTATNIEPSWFLP